MKQIFEAAVHTSLNVHKVRHVLCPALRACRGITPGCWNRGMVCYSSKRWKRGSDKAGRAVLTTPRPQAHKKAVPNELAPRYHTRPEPAPARRHPSGYGAWRCRQSRSARIAPDRRLGGPGAQDAPRLPQRLGSVARGMASAGVSAHAIRARGRWKSARTV